jgi:deaminated glutathione amidase
LAEAGIDPSVVIANIDAAYADQVRRKIPSLLHDRDFDVVVANAKAPSLVHGS